MKTPRARPLSCGVRVAVALTLGALAPATAGMAQTSASHCRVGVRLEAVLGDFADPASVREAPFVDVASMGADRWVVVESGSDPLVYDSDGSYLGTLGRRGEGPGELSHPTRVAVDPYDSLWVSNDFGRAVIFSPSGTPERTLIRPWLSRIDGFSPSGSPYSMLTRDSGQRSGPPVLFGFAQFWSRAGDSLLAVGPGHFDTDARGRVVLPLIPPQSEALNDSTLITPGGFETWVTKWTPTAGVGLVPESEVGAVLDPDARPTDSEWGLPIAIQGDGNGGFWLVGSIRQLSRMDEERLQEHLGNEPEGLPQGPFRKFHPRLRNQVFDGVLVLLRDDLTVAGAEVFDEYPWGFADENHFFTLIALESGLIQVKIWKIESDCPDIGSVTIDVRRLP